MQNNFRKVTLKQVSIQELLCIYLFVKDRDRRGKKKEQRETEIIRTEGREQTSNEGEITLGGAALRQSPLLVNRNHIQRGQKPSVPRL